MPAPRLPQRQRQRQYQCPRSRQRGITLIESLIALVVAALGILGIVGVQMRTLVDTQAAVNRGYAIRLISDLAERVQTNPNSLGNLEDYQVNTFDGTVPEADSNCFDAECDPKALAQFDREQWVNQLENTLPGGKVEIFIPKDGPRQLGILIGWNEKYYKPNEDGKDDLRTELIKIIPDGTESIDEKEIECAEGYICHLQYIQPTQRCTPWAIGGNNLYCPN